VVRSVGVREKGDVYDRICGVHCEDVDMLLGRLDDGTSI
jgi:hypothetical protein